MNDTISDRKLLKDSGFAFILQLGEQDQSQFAKDTGLPDPRYFEKAVNTYLKTVKGSIRKEMQIQVYKNYLMVLVDTINRGATRRDAEPVSVKKNDLLTQLVEQDTLKHQPLIQSLFDQALTELSQFSSAAEATKKLPELYKQLNTNKFADSLSKSLAIASGLGYSEVIDETGLKF